MKFISWLACFNAMFLMPVIAQDTTRKLSLEQLRELVNLYHPIARQANIIVEKAKADVTIARGLFDPVLQYESAQKTFEGIAYYNYNRPALLIPTWYGIEISAGLEYLGGNRTDPVETKGESSYLGISIPLARNLLMDKRRAALQSAKLYRSASYQEKRKMLNDLLLEASHDYWVWVRQYQVYQVLDQAVSTNEKRVTLVRTAYDLGDRPAIDTVEALTQLQQFELMRNQARLDLKNSALNLSLHLWTNTGKPYELPEDIIPADELSDVFARNTLLPKLDNLLEQARQQPEVLVYNYKLDMLGIEKTLKFQEILPVVDLRYNQLGRGYDVLKTASGRFYENNYNVGIAISVPLRLSQGRGEYRKARLMIEETRLQRSQKMLQVETKVKMYFNELATLQQQVILQEKAWKNNVALQRGEEIKFAAGESSLFLINARENKTLEALQKLHELRAKYLVTANKLYWAAGMLSGR